MNHDFLTLMLLTGTRQGHDMLMWRLTTRPHLRDCPTRGPTWSVAVSNSLMKTGSQSNQRQRSSLKDRQWFWSARRHSGSSLVLIHPCHLDAIGSWRLLFPCLTKGGPNRLAVRANSPYSMYILSLSFFLWFKNNNILKKIAPTVRSGRGCDPCSYRPRPTRLNF